MQADICVDANAVVLYMSSCLFVCSRKVQLTAECCVQFVGGEPLAGHSVSAVPSKGDAFLQVAVYAQF